MEKHHEAAQSLMAIDALQDDLLRQLAELEHRTAVALAECQTLLYPRKMVATLESESSTNSQALDSTSLIAPASTAEAA